MKAINLHDLSRYRSELMGVSMLVIMLFHVGGMRHDTIWYCMSRCGNVGVDMFLFLSGIGLWYAWTKVLPSPLSPQPSPLLYFYKRRLVRIYPTWLLLSSLYYVPLLIEGKFTLWQTIGNVLIGWRLWSGFVDEFWFIPMILVFYLVSPFYMMLIRKGTSWRWLPVVAMMLCVLIQYWKPMNDLLGHLEVMFSRVPIFLLGINAGLWVKEEHELPNDAFWMLVLIFVLSFGVCINFENGLRGHFPLFLERMVYIPLSISLLLLLCKLFAHTHRLVLAALGFVGTISLELYLVHVNFVLKYLKPYDLGYWLTMLLMTAIAIVMAWMVHKLMKMIQWK